MNNPRNNLKSLRVIGLILLSVVLAGALLIAMSLRNNEIPQSAHQNQGILTKQGSYDELEGMVFAVSTLPDSPERKTALLLLRAIEKDGVVSFKEYDKMTAAYDRAMNSKQGN